ncbi:hypothetical protein FHP25_24990 [Vineibacter terrae]|uniref:Uncharacterized protein n=1 Tax=Vineibacter terrae TaxID=2586908 RepID=A0A5C8PFW4_9HYPH|nr:hypothetical protein [Vineibacter terrae]TXL72555.1 hypothetical protein FHP25_24990 [Vineibacter terrae]
MPLAVREQILAALLARLGARLAPAGDGQAAVPLRRNPGDSQTERTAVDQYDGGHEAAYASDTAQSLYSLAVELELFAPDGTQLNEIYARVRDAIDDDVTFGGLAQDARERGLGALVPGTVPGHPDVIGAVLTVDIEFFTLDRSVRSQL